MDNTISKENLIMKLISKEGIEKLPDLFPKDEFLDLIIGYRTVTHSEEGKINTSPVFYEQMHEMGLDDKELQALALDNMKRMFKTVLFSIEEYARAKFTGETAADHYDDDELSEEEVYILTNEKDILGAGLITDSEMLSTIAEKMGTSYFILPSSIHELLLVPEKLNYNPHWLKELVHEVNCEAVSTGDYLSDSVYYYDKKKRKVLRAA